MGQQGVHRESSALVKRFASPQTSLGDLNAESAAALIGAASDITLVLDAAGVVRDLALQSDELLKDLGDSESWIGRPIAATVALDSRAKVEALLRDAAGSGDPKWRQINHRAADGRSVPVLYCCVPVGVDGRMVAFGRDLRVMSALQQRLVNAQQSMERDYSRLRDIEMRYRLLFQLSSEAVLILDAAKLRVTEANPAARGLFGVEVGELAGLGLSHMFSGEGAGQVQAHLDAVRSGLRVDDVPVQTAARAARGGRDVLVKASVFRQDGETLFLIRVTAVQEDAAPAPLADVKTKLLRAVESAPDGFVVTDHHGQVITANAAFLEMAQLTHEDQARDRPLETWVGSSGVDMTVLMANLRQRGAVRFFATTLRGQAGESAQVEISAVSVLNGGHPSFGFAIRNVGPRLAAEPQAAGPRLPRSVEQLTELIGRVPLKDLVREATEVIERLCIEAALELTSDNRASAAEMLGLSRQSLYVKLRRYGLGDLSPAAEE
ncbi:MAG: transcriptional regulator PpsR [Acetobacteraceae bacterium]